VSTLLVNAAVLALIGLVVWWFWLSKPRARQAVNDAVMRITVADGVYDPPRLSVSPGREVELEFLRRDPSPCAARVTFAGLDTSIELPVGTPVRVRLPALAPGEYAFTCDMQMYRGTLVVRGARDEQAPA